MAQAAQFTVAEAAFVLREPIRAVKKALDAGPVRPVLLRRAGAPVRAIDKGDLFYLYAVRELREELTPKARTEFYDAFRRTLTEDSDEVFLGRLRIAIADLVQEVEQRTASLAELSEKVAFRADGEPVLKGTDTEVHRIAALLDGELSVDEVLEDYPSLSREQVETAGAYAEAHPKAGRPYPRTTAKRALRDAGLEALDEVWDDDRAGE
jgi:uncharacterized protein (DUF433 family)